MKGEPEIKVSVGEGVKKLKDLSKDRRFWWIIPQTIWTGASIAYFSGNLQEMIQYNIPYDKNHDKDWNEQNGNFLSNLSMVWFGVGEVLGCFFIGFFIDKIGSKISAVINVFLAVLMGATTLVFVHKADYNIWAQIMCFCWGFQDSAINTHAQEILGFEFDDNYTPFSLYNIWQSASCFIFQLIVSQVNDNTTYFWYTLFATLMASVCCGVTYFFPFREHLAQVNNLSHIGSFHSFHSNHHQSVEHKRFLKDDEQQNKKQVIETVPETTESNIYDD